MPIDQQLRNALRTAAQQQGLGRDDVVAIAEAITAAGYEIQPQGGGPRLDLIEQRPAKRMRVAGAPSVSLLLVQMDDPPGPGAIAQFLTFVESGGQRLPPVVLSLPKLEG